MVGRGRPLGARRGDRIERAAPLVVVALSCGVSHFRARSWPRSAICTEDTLHTERAELVRDRAIRAAIASCCLRHRVTLPRVGLTGKREVSRRRE